MYANGEGVPEDDAEAVRWWRLAAAQGDVAAQYNLGVMCAVGDGVLKDDAEAVRWWRLAAAQGDVDAQYALGSVYAGAHGGLAEVLREAEAGADPFALFAGFLLGSVPTDFVLAHMWLNIAAANGHEDAALGRTGLELIMTAADVSRATELAGACMASDYRDCPAPAGDADGVASGDRLALDPLTRRLIQQGLANAGFDPGMSDGLFGPQTRAAIRDWQAARGAAATGYLDAVQADLLRSAAAAESEAQAGVEGVGRTVSRPGPNVTGSEFFTRGSHQDDVLRLQGTPTGIDVWSDSETWWYGLSTVTISTRSREVTEWSNLEGNLRVRLVPGHVEDDPPRAAEPAPGSVLLPGPDIVNPRLFREVRPEYTAEALRAKIAGTVYLEMVVLPDGTVGDVRITQSLDPGLDEEAVKAARQWVFEPGTRFGEPVAVQVNLALDFNLR